MSMKNIFIRPLVITLLILLIPLFANHRVEGWNWTFFDFVFAFVVFFGSGLAYSFLSTRMNGFAYKAGIAVAVFSSLVLIWVNAAVGIIGNDNGTNLLYLGVILLGLIGICVAHFKASGMARAAFLMAAALFLVPFVALIFWPSLEWGEPGILGVFILNSIFVALFIVSGLLLRHVALQTYDQTL